MPRCCCCTHTLALSHTHTHTHTDTPLRANQTHKRQQRREAKKKHTHKSGKTFDNDNGNECEGIRGSGVSRSTARAAPDCTRFAAICGSHFISTQRCQLVAIIVIAFAEENLKVFYIKCGKLRRKIAKIFFGQLGS